VTVVCPGPIDTGFLDTGGSAGVVEGVDIRRYLTRAAGRAITPETVAAATLRGIRHNRAVVAPGRAGLIWRAARLSPRLADLAPVPLARPMHYTSGTTGTPKGVWSGVLDEATAGALHDDESAVWAFSADDRLLVASPLHHSAPLRFSTGVLLAGGEVCVLERFDAAAVADAIATFRPTLAFFVPAHLHRLFALGALPRLDSFRLLAHAGAPCPVAP